MKVNVITENGEFKTFYNELDEVKENLDYIISIKEQRIKSLEKENSELKNNEYYRKLEDENKNLRKIISNSFIITEEENQKIKVVIDKYTLMTKLPEKLEEFKATSTEQEAMIDYLKNRQEISLENENKFVYKG